MTAREQAIAAAEAALFDQEAGVGGGGTAWWQRDTVAAETVLAAAVPVLLNDLADRIEARRDGAPYRPGDPVVIYTEGYNDAIRNVAAVVRAAAGGWGQ